MANASRDRLHLLENYKQWKPEEIEGYLAQIKEEHTEASNFLDDRPELLGEFGYSMGNDSYCVEEYRPVHIETTMGRMELS